MTVARSRPSADPMDRYGVAREAHPEQSVELVKVGQSYRCAINPLGATLLFRDVRVDRDLSADIAVATRRGHLFRTGSVSLGMRSRSEIARTAQELSGVSDLPTWKQGVFRATELVMEAEEHLDGAVDLRSSGLTTKGALYAVRPVVYSGPTDSAGIATTSLTATRWKRWQTACSGSTDAPPPPLSPLRGAQ